jgi:hypothetical protein
MFHSSYDPPGANAKRRYVAGYMVIDEHTLLPKYIGRYPCILPDRSPSRVDWQVAYPCGALHQSGQWMVSYGHHDTSIRIDLLRHEELMHAAHVRPAACLNAAGHPEVMPQFPRCRASLDEYLPRLDDPPFAQSGSDLQSTHIGLNNQHVAQDANAFARNVEAHIE